MKIVKLLPKLIVRNFSRFQRATYDDLLASQKIYVLITGFNKNNLNLIYYKEC